MEREQLFNYPFLKGEVLSRFNLSKYDYSFPIPNLLEVQRKSYELFLQRDIPPEKRKDVGIHRVFKNFQITVKNRRIEYVDYKIEDPKYTPEECKNRDLTYGGIMRVKLRLLVSEGDEFDESKVKEKREEWVYFGEIPMMTERCSFIIGGTEKAVVSQVHKSPGAYFEYDKQKYKVLGRVVPIARIVPYKGQWIDFDFDQKDIMHVRLQKKRRFNAWLFLRSLGLDMEDLLDIYDTEWIYFEPANGGLSFWREVNPFLMTFYIASIDYKDRDGNIIVRAGRKFTGKIIGRLLENCNDIRDVEVEELGQKKKVKMIKISEDEIANPKKYSVSRTGIRIFAEDIKVDGKLLFKAGEKVTPEKLRTLFDFGINAVKTVWFDDNKISGSIRRTWIDLIRKVVKIRKDAKLDEDDYIRVEWTPQDAAAEFFRKTKPGEPQREAVYHYIRSNYMSPRKFNLAKVGRYAIMRKFGLDRRLKIRWVKSEGRFYKELIPEILRFQFASVDVQVGDRVIKAGERFKKEDVAWLVKNGVKWVPCSQEELYEYAVPEKFEIDGIRLGKFDRLNRYVIDRIKEKDNFELEVVWFAESLTLLDIWAVLRYLFELKASKPGRNIDDVDNLANRRVRPVGELAEMELSRGLEKVKRLVEEKLAQLDVLEDKQLKDIVNFKPASSQLKEFFAMGQLAQFLDNTNPLSELTHKRRMSALGPGGLKRETAGIEVRDVHPSHYGKMCPVETPEGQNVGLITTMALYSRVSDIGLLETPYRKVEDGKVTDKVEYLSALDEQNVAIAPFGTPVDENGYIKEDKVVARVGSDIKLVDKNEVKYMDVSPLQILGVSASLIPFFERNDSNRALMGSNMQRQAVPLLFTEPPIVGAGHEKEVAKNALAALVAKRSGVVKYVDSTQIVIETDDPDFPEERGVPEVYRLTKYSRSNHNTAINWRPLVSVGERVKRGQIIADGPATAGGELALGRNLLVAIMSWRGYNFEDSIVISERLVWDDVFTSVHIEELSVDVRETKHGPEEITSDIPNVSASLLKNLDEDGIVRVGAFVNPGDIVVGKITPVGEAPQSPEDRLLKSIFGKTTENIRDTSLRCPPDVRGIVIGVWVHYRKNVEKTPRILEQERRQIEKLRKEKDEAIRILRGKLKNMIEPLLEKVSIVQPVRVGQEEFSENTERFRRAIFRKIEEYRDVKNIRKYFEELEGYFDEETYAQIMERIKEYEEQEKRIVKVYREREREIRQGEELPPGVLMRVRVLIASKRKIQVGDKLAGRHGNKGVISIILPREDMPFLPDGTPIDIVLSPLGIPSRMNLGQLFEMQLGWVGKELGRRIAEAAEELAIKYRARRMVEIADKIKNKVKEILSDGEDKTGVIERFLKWIQSIPDEDMDKFVKEAKEVGVRFSAPAFGGITEDDIIEFARRLGIPETFKVKLRDGRTGEEFAEPVAVGYMYIMKLIHMVEDKIHARSTGKYSLITQQPLGGKSRGGGQRFGEMEVWALEAYGAAYTLQEMLTVKSDDMVGREIMVSRIIEGKPIFKPFVPESFMVLVKELQALGFSIRYFTKQELEEFLEEMEGDKKKTLLEEIEKEARRRMIRGRKK